MPPRNATGMKTAERTSTIATSAPETSFIAFCAAAKGPRPSVRMMRSMFSSTTIASSTTMPIESVIAKSVSVLSEKPRSQRPAIVPIRDTGTASIGMRVARQLCRKRKTTMSTRMPASPNVR